MNANELANLLEVDSWYKLVTREEIATMLRQQQNEIEALRNQLWDLKSEPWGFDRQPVKELDEQFEKGFKAGKEEGWKAHKFHHPVKEQDESFDRTASHMAGEYVSYPVKELTDEEITEVITKIANNNEYVYSLYEDFEGIEFSRIGIFEFARAILRKAQEK